MTTNVTDQPLLMSTGSDNSRAMIPPDAFYPYRKLTPHDALKHAYWACALNGNNWINGTLVRTVVTEDDDVELMQILNSMDEFITDLKEVGKEKLLTNVVYALWTNGYEVNPGRVNKAAEIKKAINSSKFEKLMDNDLYTALAGLHVAVTSASNDSKWVDETFSRMREIHKHVYWNLKVGDGKKHCLVKVVNSSPRKFLQELISKACDKKYGVSLKTKTKGKKMTENEGKADMEERDQSALHWQCKKLFGKNIYYRFTKRVWKNSNEMDILEYRKCLTSLSDLAAKLNKPVEEVISDYRSTEAGMPLTSSTSAEVPELHSKTNFNTSDTPTATSNGSGTLASSGTSIPNATAPIMNLPSSNTTIATTNVEELGPLDVPQPYPNANITSDTTTATSDGSGTLVSSGTSILNAPDGLCKTVSADTDDDATVDNSFVDALEDVGNTDEIGITEKTVIVDDNSNRVFPCPNAIKDDHECVHARCSNCHNNILVTAPRVRKRRKAGEVPAVGVCDHTKAHPIHASWWQIVGPTADNKRANGVRLPTKCADCQARFVKK